MVNVVPRDNGVTVLVLTGMSCGAPFDSLESLFCFLESALVNFAGTVCYQSRTGFYYILINLSKILLVVHFKCYFKGLSHEIDFKNVDIDLQN
jgi:hypothetical protein